MSACYNNMPAV